MSIGNSDIYEKIVYSRRLQLGPGVSKIQVLDNFGRETFLQLSIGEGDTIEIKILLLLTILMYYIEILSWMYKLLGTHTN